MSATHADVAEAIAYANRCREGERPVYAIRFAHYGSRTHTRAVDIVLTGNARHRSQSDREHYAATYDEWGAFLAYLFDVDPDVKAGPYADAEEFERITDGAFRITHVRQSDR